MTWAGYDSFLQLELAGPTASARESAEASHRGGFHSKPRIQAISNQASKCMMLQGVGPQMSDLVYGHYSVAGCL
jgi:hypothetical protein